MPHPPELIIKIKEKLLLDYSENEFVYQFEEWLPEAFPDRMAPDLIIRERSGRVVCCVEVGYTRPEKLRKYKQIGVKDVRWYAKTGELMNQQHETIRVLAHVPSKLECFYHCLLVKQFPCPKCLESFSSYIERWSSDSQEEIDSQASEQAESATYTHCWISDCNRGVAVSFCDECEHFEVHHSGQGSPFENPLLNLSFKDINHFLYRQKVDQIDIGALILSTYRQEWETQWPLPPNKCSFEQIENFVKYWFDPSLMFEYEQMAPIFSSP